MDPENIGIALTTVPIKEPVFQNGTGYEQYGDFTTAGYYSYPRLDATGYLIVHGDTAKVSGQLWYDRQWNCGTNLIGGGTGWDWISVQFENTNEDLMVYRVEDRKLSKELHGGSFHRQDGTVVFLDDGELQMKPLTYWTSPETKRKYPVSWQVTIPKLEVDVKVEAVFPQQELILTRMGFRFPYWEGMCKVTGTIAGEIREGNAYLEMTNRPKER
jgi:predicted secreted hydrolase